ncbi:MAG: efflux RND transporter periplasmic adaptor subunit [Acidobacteria bacterium]|nr:efflux RND transporter periplasmic adaptor subunit [Acidobacteriota bacterium]
MKWTACLLLAIVATGCQKPSPVATAPQEADPHPESFTNWTTKTELFMEYPPLVSGQTSRFAIHLTRLDNFKAISKGKVEVRLAGADGKTDVVAADAPSRPGIFGVDVKAPSAGDYRLAVHFTGEGITDVHDLGEIASSPTKAAATHEHGAATQETIAFLKEQQWTLDFGTAIVEDRQIKSGLRVPAEVIPRSGGQAEVTVPFDGRIVASTLPVIGASVRQGQVLASILPPTSSPSDLASLELAKNEANLSLQLARKDRERAERLVKAGAAPAKRLDEAQTVEATAEARLKASEARIAQYEASSSAEPAAPGAKVFALRAPISGVIVETHAAPGANVNTGETLFKIVDLETVYVSAVVPEAEIPRVRNLSGAELELPGLPQPRRLSRLISVGRVVDPASRTFPVIYAMDNSDRRVAINQAVHVRLLTTGNAAAPAVPESAIVDDGGRPVVFIQASGETFLRKPVQLGLREGGYVQVLEGVFPGERVVTRGAHLIRLAAMSNQVPSHGHVH